MNPFPKIENATGLQWRRVGDGLRAVWVARADYRKRGYRPPTQRLWTGLEPDQEAKNYISSECQRLNADMLRWAGVSPDGPPRLTGTLSSLIDCYRRDPDSGFHKLRIESRRTYNSNLRAIDAAVGKAPLAGIKGRDLHRWYENWRDGNAHVPRAHQRMTLLRLLMSFGAAILEDDQCKRLSFILGELRFQGGGSRDAAMTADQATAIRKAAHELEMPMVAFAQALAFDLGLRPKDLLGEYLPSSEPGVSDVIQRGKKWLFGLHWRNVSPDLILTHRLSKSLHGKDAVTDKRAGKVKRFDLKLYPMVMEELAKIPLEARVGPMIIDPATGLPYLASTFRIRWRTVADAAGVSGQFRDSRPGAITEGIEATDGDLEANRHAAGHSDSATTQLYSRASDKQTAKVAVLRAQKRAANSASNGVQSAPDKTRR